MNSPFLYCVCQPGSEDFLKGELARTRPEARFSFSRPGFATFRFPKPLPATAKFPLVFARVQGVQAAKLKHDPAAADFAAAWDRAVTPLLANADRTVIHVFERERHAVGEEPRDYVRHPWRGPWLAALGAWSEARGVRLQTETKPGDRRIDVVLLDAHDAWLGVQDVSETRDDLKGSWRVPGGNPDLALPAESPSRAYLKAEEEIAWSGIRLEKGDRAIEIGSAPGGACYALLCRGLRVVGVDSAAMAEAVAKNPGFTHVPTSVVQFHPAGRGMSAEWLFLDMNTEPKVSIAEATKVAKEIEADLLGVFFTIKLNQDKFAGFIDEYVDRVRREAGLVWCRATQLPSNKREFCIVGVTARGRSRMKGLI